MEVTGSAFMDCVRYFLFRFRLVCPPYRKCEAEDRDMVQLNLFGQSLVNTFGKVRRTVLRMSKEEVV
ncbi:hypothetical protein ADUPG1_001661, partial [Aduncisulcus paluster]